MDSESWIKKYIPAGCLSVSVDGLGLPDEISQLVGQHPWKFLSRPDDEAIPHHLRLPLGLQEGLLGAPELRQILQLFRSRWIQLQTKPYAACSDSLLCVRVYVLPHDTDRSAVDRRDLKLAKSLFRLFSQLDFAPMAWQGYFNPHRQGSPSAREPEGLRLDRRGTLLQMFNEVPSPAPDPGAVRDENARELVNQLLESSIPGLCTDLYPYQRRSAALMLQRELEPGRTVDPRLQCVVDQTGRPYYYDNVTGVTLREPRLYDGVCGGILAEEMGTGKTLICLAVILATQHEPATVPEPQWIHVPVRRRTASLLDMAAAAANRHSVPWRPYFEALRVQLGYEYCKCVDTLEKGDNSAFYYLQSPLVEPRRGGRVAPNVTPAKKICLSSSSLVVVPNNLVTQWRQEIKKHTSGLSILVLTEKAEIPPITSLLRYDVILFSHSRFEKIEKDRSAADGRQVPAEAMYCPLEYIRFKRCIVDEGHKLGNNSGQWRSDLMRGLDNLEIGAHWVVTGTPSRGLYGTTEKLSSLDPAVTDAQADDEEVRGSGQVAKQERADLQRIGNIASKFLKLRPWSNTRDEAGDCPAEWNVYVMQPKHHNKSAGRVDSLRSTLNSLIVRHRLSDIGALLPPVNNKVVLLEGSFQDKLALNLFSMFIIFNSIQSQRTDVDYFFHPKQRKSLMQLVHNLKQACFFGGVFFSTEVITKSLETVENFLKKGEVPISVEDDQLLRDAIAFGYTAANNRLKAVSNQYHAMPLYLEHFPGGKERGRTWSLDDDDAEDAPICTDAGLVLALQKFLNPCLDAPTSLQMMIDKGHLECQGQVERTEALAAVQETAGENTTQSLQSKKLAGNTVLGDDHVPKPKSGMLAKTIDISTEETSEAPANLEIAEALAKTQIISTVSAKLSYLIDAIVKYKDDEQIIVFYDNDNIAYYLAGVLEILQIQHLIYTRAGLSADRRAQYVATFTHNPRFRVLLMDISQAAFGLDMRSASRIYFIGPVLNPQVEAQAVGRVRRISQQRPVTVETLVLRGSIEELVVERRRHMTPAEHRRVKTLLDDRPLYNWILNARILRMPSATEDGVGEGVAQTARLETPQLVFGRGFGRVVHPDEGLVTTSPERRKDRVGEGEPGGAQTTDGQQNPGASSPTRPSGLRQPPKRPHQEDPAAAEPKVKRARVAWADEEES